MTPTKSLQTTNIWCHGKNLQEKKTLLLDFKTKATKVCISTQVNDPPNDYTQAFINSFS
jgi:hypothetical protein